MAGFHCQGLENKCSFKCCSPTNLEVSLHDIANLYPEKIRWGDLDFVLDNSYLRSSEYFRMVFVMPLEGEPCKFLQESGKEGYECTLENEGFGLDVCKTWPVITALSEDGFRPAILNKSYCPALQHPLKDEIVNSLFEKTKSVRREKEFYNQDFSRFVSGKELYWEDFSHYLLEWVRGLDLSKLSEGTGFFSLKLSGINYPKVSFKSSVDEVKTLK
ncbi:MAG: hypothetical protein GOU97_03000 [Nanoarchaeota archaeon]|nr:hypothetical protein [Nanoarchaeota archaeon]